MLENVSWKNYSQTNTELWKTISFTFYEIFYKNNPSSSSDINTYYVFNFDARVFLKPLIHGKLIWNILWIKNGSIKFYQSSFKQFTSKKLCKHGSFSAISFLVEKKMTLEKIAASTTINAIIIIKREQHNKLINLWLEWSNQFSFLNSVKRKRKRVKIIWGWTLIILTSYLSFQRTIFPKKIIKIWAMQSRVH